MSIISSVSREGNDGIWGGINIGDYVIIRTYSAGVWFGVLDEFRKGEVILSNARMMYRWQAKKSISLSGCAKFGIVADDSKICPAVSKVWLQAIEVLPLTKDAAHSIINCPDVEAS